MTRCIYHPVHGEIVYNESLWTGKKTITINGAEAKVLSKKEFEFQGKRILVKGNELFGAEMYIDNETVQISPKPKWYEALLGFLPFIFLLTWGNSSALCSIFPVVGGGIGGLLGGFASISSLSLMKKTPLFPVKLLIGIGIFVLTVLIAFVLALALLQLLI